MRSESVEIASSLALPRRFQWDTSGLPKKNISLHLKINFAENDLMEKAVVKEYFTTASDGKLKNSDVSFINLILEYLCRR